MKNQHDHSEFRARLSARLSALNLSMRDVSIRAGMNPDTLGKFLTGRTRTMRADNLKELARVLEVSESWLVGSSDEAHMEPLPFGVKFGGTADAGAFRPQDVLDQEGDIRRVPIPHDWRFPSEAQFAFRIAGDSMDKARIFDGMHVLALEVHAWERANGPLRDGLLVIVARSRAGQAERELTLKRLRITREAMILQPESNNPKWRAITFPLPLKSDQTAEGDHASVVAVCLQAVWILT